ncbi:oxidoreductase [Streptomyces sp. T-3]|nr:oxidoreductase [Streptomyces sp. T-3]
MSHTGWGPQGQQGPYAGPPGWGPPPPPAAPQPGVIPLAPLDLGGIFNGAFRTMGRYAKPLFGVLGVAYALLAVVVTGALVAAYLSVDDELDIVAHLEEGSEGPGWEVGRPILIAFVIAWAVCLLAMIVVNSFVSAAGPAVLEEAVLGRPVSFKAVWRRAWARTPSVLGVGVLLALLIAVPIVLCTGVGFLLVLLNAAGGGSPLWGIVAVVLLLMASIPAVAWLAVRYSLAPTAAVLESAGPLTAMRRSARLVRGAWWRTFGILALSALVVGTASMMIRVPFQILTSQAMVFSTEGTPDDASEALTQMLPELGVILVVSIVVHLIVQTTTTAFMQLVAGLVYIDRRIRKEGLADSLARTAGL